MASETEVIREQMEGTRTALAEKVGLLEAQVTEKMQQASTTVADTVESVAETVDNVKETVEGTVQAVKHTFDLQWHADHHPWLLVGGSVVLGLLGGRILRGPSERPRSRGRTREAPPAALPAPPPPAPPAAETKPQSSAPGLLGRLGQEIGDLKQLGIGMALGVLREVVIRAVPAKVGPMLSDAVNSLTEKLGGKPLGVSQPDQATTNEPRSQPAPTGCDVGCL